MAIHVRADALTGPGPEPRGWQCAQCGKTTDYYDHLYRDRSCTPRTTGHERATAPTPTHAGRSATRPEPIHPQTGGPTAAPYPAGTTTGEAADSPASPTGPPSAQSSHPPTSKRGNR